MADAGDISVQLQEEELESRINAARMGGHTLPGPVICQRCDYPNDRANEGWAICSDCAVGTLLKLGALGLFFWLLLEVGQ